ncbi:hypothetical protein Bra3105_06745 [Brachybacterium halotolerans subsp. kimchii]|uniref:hypothetical protein n=1 Tax=Brachybacterium halotolerans TaxID=2795215 RepID=UPI001E4E2A97|nr:hypothetical protein [Brachybacterium halotolerans]UEJ84005.1 hypothetical protein Bra3105_06745 [Brachybacterium halotolerans subsp. kimchii]
MSLSITTKKYGGGDDSWLGSRHAVDNAQTGTLDAAAFASAADGLVKSGTPVKAQGGKFVPAGADAPTGFVLGDHSVKDGDDTAAIVWHGLIVVENLPVEGFTVPADKGAFTYVGGTAAGEEA